MVQLHWIKNVADGWLDFQHFGNLSDVTAYGVYIIWHDGNPGRVVRVGQGDIKSRLTAHRSDASITAYAQRGTLRVTWAAASSAQVDGIERYLADNWHPLVGDAFPDVAPIAVNSPW